MSMSRARRSRWPDGSPHLPRVAVASTKRFFAPLINGSAEASDMLANRIFAENCSDDALEGDASQIRHESLNRSRKQDE